MANRPRVRHQGPRRRRRLVPASLAAALGGGLLVSAAGPASADMNCGPAMTVRGVTSPPIPCYVPIDRDDFWWDHPDPRQATGVIQLTGTTTVPAADSRVLERALHLFGPDVVLHGAALGPGRLTTTEQADLTTARQTVATHDLTLVSVVPTGP